MPDRYDPKLSVRSTGGRPPAEGPERQESNVDDPLVELARIVSGSSNSENHTGRPEESSSQEPPAASEATPQQPLPSEADLAKDLESELLNELQASFSTIPDIVGQPAPPPVPPKPQPQPQIQPQTQPFTPPPKPTIAQQTVPLDEPSYSPQSEWVQPNPVQPRIARPGAKSQSEKEQTERRRETFASRIARAVHGVDRSDQSKRTQQSERPARTEPDETQTEPPPPPTKAPQPPSGGAGSETDSDQFRPKPARSLPSEPIATPLTSVVTHWDPVPESQSRAQPSFDPGRFAPRGDDRGRRPVDPLPAEPFAYAESLPFEASEDDFIDDRADGDNFNTVPGCDDEDALGYPEDDYVGSAPRQSRRRSWIIGGLIGVAIVGAAALITLSSVSTDGPPPIITADASPTKVTPDVTGTSDTEGPAKLIYERVDPNAEIADSLLVLPGTDQLADIPPIPDDAASGDVSRVILNGDLQRGPSGGDVESAAAPLDLVGDGGMAVASPTGPAAESAGPKMVRTVVVRPDGTIVSSEASPEARVEETLAGLPPASETPPAPAAEENPLLGDTFGSELSTDLAPSAPSNNLAVGSIPDIPPPAPSPALVPRPTRPPESPTIVATPGDLGGPIDLNPGVAAPMISTQGSGGGFMVQVSSQRSREVALATFGDLQRRYPGVLAGREPDIQRADLGERGVYFRVRVGYPTREQAMQMCESLKSAGGDCILATR